MKLFKQLKLAFIVLTGACRVLIATSHDERRYAAFAAKIKDVFHDATKDEPSTWSADAETVAQDHALRKTK